MNMASYKNGMNKFIWCFITVVLCIDGQPDYLKPEIDLCEKLPGFEPNGAHLPSPGDKIMAYVNWAGPNKPQMCLMRFSTCESCRLRVTPLSTFEFYQCAPSENYRRFDGWCAPGCTYLHLYDRDYSNATAKSYSNVTFFEDYVTQSRYLYVIACANKSVEDRIFMKINISSEAKSTIFQATSTDVGKPLTSPFFPDEYALNSEVYKYTFLCASQDEFITISFDDWQLADTSSLTFDSANVVGPVKGSHSRPWIISNSFQLVMTFNTGSYYFGGHIGFKATYKFQKEKDRNDMPAIVTNCGDWITQRESGIISFNPTFNGRDYYDCLWVIEKHDSYDGVMVKVINYSISGVYTSSYQMNQLDIRSGLTSIGEIQESAVPTTNPRDTPVFGTLTSSDGFYVRLKGHYSGSRDFVLAFASFKTDNCKNLFLCDNGRCIPSYLKCDGIDHCGDYSDESYLLCGPSTSSGGSGIQYGSTLSVGIIIPIVVSVFLLIVICLLVIFIRRCRKLSIEAHRSRQFGQHVSTISGTVSSRQRYNRRRGHGPGPTFEPPPAYDEVLHSTPIGYLNIAFSDRQSNPLTGLLEPPSYEEAMTPTESCPPSSSHDLSSGSSSPETIALSHFSSSYSSDDMHPGDDHCHEYQNQLHNNNSVSSSDASSEDMDHANAWPNVRLSPGNGVAVRQKGNVEQPNSRRSIAKPVNENVCSVEVPLSECPSNKQLNHNKKGSQQANEEDLNQTTPSIMSSARDLENTRRFSQAAITEDPSSGTFCHVENSPVICVPPVAPSDSTRLPQTGDSSCRGDRDVPKMGILSAQCGTDANMLSSRQREQTPQKRYTRNPNASESKQPRQDAEGKKVHDGGKRRHLGKNGHTPYSLLSRSMVDISRQGEEVSVKPLQTTKMLSKSVDNIHHASPDGQSVHERNRLDYGGAADDSVLTPGHWNEAAALPEHCVPFERDAGRDHGLGGKDGVRPTPRPRKSLLRKNKSGQMLDAHESSRINDSQQQQRSQRPDTNSAKDEQIQRSRSNMSSEGRNIPDPVNHRHMHDVGKDGKGNSRSESSSPGNKDALSSGMRERQNGSRPRFSPPVNSFNHGGQETGRSGIDKWPELTQSTGNASDPNSKKLPGQMNNHSHDMLPRNMQPNSYQYEREHPRDVEPRSESSGGRLKSSRNPAGQNSGPALDRPPQQGDNSNPWPDLPQHARLPSGQNRPQQPRDASGEFSHRYDRPPQQDGRSTGSDASQQHRMQSHDGRSRPPREAAAEDQFGNNRGRPSRQGGEGPPRSEGFHYPRGQLHEKAPPSSRNAAAVNENSTHRVRHAAPSASGQPDSRSAGRALQQTGDGISQGNNFSGHNRPMDPRSVQPNSSRDGHVSSTAKARYSKPGMVHDTSTGSPKDYANTESRKGAVSNGERQAEPFHPDNAPVCLQLENDKPGDMFV